MSNYCYILQILMSVRQIPARTMEFVVHPKLIRISVNAHLDLMVITVKSVSSANLILYTFTRKHTHEGGIHTLSCNLVISSIHYCRILHMYTDNQSVTKHNCCSDDMLIDWRLIS